MRQQKRILGRMEKENGNRTAKMVAIHWLHCKKPEYDVTMTYIDATVKRTENRGRAIVSGCGPIISDEATKLAQ